MPYCPYYFGIVCLYLQSVWPISHKIGCVVSLWDQAILSAIRYFAIFFLLLKKKRIEYKMKTPEYFKECGKNYSLSIPAQIPGASGIIKCRINQKDEIVNFFINESMKNNYTMIYSFAALNPKGLIERKLSVAACPRSELCKCLYYLHCSSPITPGKINSTLPEMTLGKGDVFLPNSGEKIRRSAGLTTRTFYPMADPKLLVLHAWQLYGFYTSDTSAVTTGINFRFSISPAACIIRFFYHHY